MFYQQSINRSEQQSSVTTHKQQQHNSIDTAGTLVCRTDPLPLITSRCAALFCPLATKRFKFNHRLRLCIRRPPCRLGTVRQSVTRWRPTRSDQMSNRQHHNHGKGASVFYPFVGRSWKIAIIREGNTETPGKYSHSVTQPTNCSQRVCESSSQPVSHSTNLVFLSCRGAVSQFITRSKSLGTEPHLKSLSTSFFANSPLLLVQQSTRNGPRWRFIIRPTATFERNWINYCHSSIELRQWNFR